MPYSQREIFFRPFASGQYKLNMGMERVPPDEWIEIDDQFVTCLAKKRALAAQRHPDVFGALPEAEGASSELLESLGTHLTQYFPNIFRREGQDLVNLATAEIWNIKRPQIHPLDLAGRLVQEDLCLQLPMDGQYKLAAVTLCAPGAWKFQEKLGKSLSDIHVPVPGYAEQLSRSVNRFFDKFEAENFYCRRLPNWGVFTSPELFQPERIPATLPLNDANAGDNTWVRTEKHVFHRLPNTRAVVFTLRMVVTRVSDAIRNEEDATHLASAVRSMSPETLDYKGLTTTSRPLLAWLDRRAAKPT